MSKNFSIRRGLRRQNAGMDSSVEEILRSYFLEVRHQAILGRRFSTDRLRLFERFPQTPASRETIEGLSVNLQFGRIEFPNRLEDGERRRERTEFVPVRYAKENSSASFPVILRVGRCRGAAGSEMNSRKPCSLD